MNPTKMQRSVMFAYIPDAEEVEIENKDPSRCLQNVHGPESVTLPLFFQKFRNLELFLVTKRSVWE